LLASNKASKSFAIVDIKFDSFDTVKIRFRSAVNDGSATMKANGDDCALVYSRSGVFVWTGQIPCNCCAANLGQNFRRRLRSKKLEMRIDVSSPPLLVGKQPCKTRFRTAARMIFSGRVWI
jgi:hypothetical protein